MFKQSKYNIFKNINGEQFLYNSINKSYIKINEQFSIEQIIADINTGDIKDSYLELINNGYIIDDQFDELKTFEYAFKKHYFNSSELNIILMPTLQCNFDCPYCFEAPCREIKTDKEYYTTLKKYSERYFKHYNHVEISLFGGEPLLESEGLLDFLHFTSELSQKYSFTYGSSVTTNGSLLTNQIVNKLITYNCSIIQITIDGGRNSHNKTRCYKNGLPSFDNLINIINTTLKNSILESKIHFLLRINLNNNTLEEVSETLTAIDRNIRENISIAFRPVYNTEVFTQTNQNTMDSLKEFYELARSLNYQISKNCYFYRSCESCSDENFYYILPDLSLRKCVNTLTLDHGKFGNISYEGEVIIDSQKVVNWYKAADCFSDKKCLDCKLLPDCMGGCILYNINNSKRLCSPFEVVSLPYIY